MPRLSSNPVTYDSQTPCAGERCKNTAKNHRTMIDGFKYREPKNISFKLNNMSVLVGKRLQTLLSFYEF